MTSVNITGRFDLQEEVNAILPHMQLPFRVMVIVQDVLSK